VPEPNAAEATIGKQNMYESPGVKQIAAELVKAGGEALRSEIRKFIIKLIWNKEELPHQWKESTVLPVTKRVIKLTSNYRGISLLSTSHNILTGILLSRLTPYADELLGNMNVDFNVMNPQMITFTIPGRY
jgi:hypothetical protein